MLKTRPQMYAMTKNFLSREALHVFKCHYKKIETRTKKYKTVIKGLVTHIFPTNALQHQNRYLHRGLFKT